MSIEKTCCNCLHCARWKTSKGIECHCDLTDKYLGYITVMSETACKSWEKETKWDEQKKHDAEVRADTIKEFVKAIENRQTRQDSYLDPPYLEMGLDITDVLEVAEQLKEQKE